MRMNRREFIHTSLAGAGGLILHTGTGEGTSKTFDPYERISLGNTGLVVSRTCAGTGMRGGMRESNQTRKGQEHFTALIRGEYDRGINMYDLADLYGTHSYFATAMQGIPRDRYVVATKIWFRQGGLPESERPDADVLVERFLKELKTDYIDLVLMHCVTSEKWPEELARQLDLLAACKEKGLIRAHGVSCHSLGALKAAVDEPWVDSVHARINPYGAKMDGPPEEVAPVLKKLHDAGKGVVGMKLIGEGTFRDSDTQRTESVRYVLGLGTVDVLNVGFERLEEVDDFAARVRSVPRNRT